MIVEALAVISGGLIGFSVTWKLVEKGIREEEMKMQEVRRAKVTTISEAIAKKEETSEVKPVEMVPTNLSELVDYLRDKYMLYDVTILTMEGLPIASNSETPDEDAATAPELLKVARRTLNTENVVISSERGKLIVMQITPEILLHARSARDIPQTALERLKEETARLLEGII